MRRTRLALIPVALVLIACQAAASLLPGGAAPFRAGPFTATPTPTATAAPTPTPLPPTPAPPTAEPAPLAGPAPLPLPAALPPLADAPFTVRIHPEGGLYQGDQVSFEIIAPPGLSLDQRQAVVMITPPQGAPLELEPAGFGGFGIARRTQATLQWAWDTTGDAPGVYAARFSIAPAGPVWTQTLALLPSADLPAGQIGAAWAVTETQCCTLHYITGTAAGRDIAALAQMVEAQADSVEERLGAGFNGNVEIVFLPRVLGHGGFASDEISVSYLDRNYAGNGSETVIHHEMVHFLDAQLGGELRPIMLVEGLAVYLTGGHFKPEPLLERAAALPGLGLYIPLGELADNFYPSQHEVGYLQAGALVEYMVERWGWERFSAFYRGIQPAESRRQSAAIDAALRTHFNLGFNELEEDFLDALAAQPENPAGRDDVRLTVAFYDTLRRYQQALDPAAYFLTAWLPGGEEMRQRGIVADYLRHPRQPENLAFETLLVTAEASLRGGDFAAVERLLGAANSVLQAMESGQAAAAGVDVYAGNALFADYYQVAKTLLAQGWEVQRLELDGDAARAWAVAPDVAAAGGPDLVQLDLRRSAQGWVFSSLR